ncbi:MAG: YdcF family protein [Acidobacteriia bacterium]|nr:YdcF family protein [Terriglobia bacterium]
MARRSLRVRLLFALAIVLVAIIAARSFWLAALGYALIHNDGPAKADIAVVLAGEYLGYRLETAAALVRDGYVPAVLVSGPGSFYGLHESDLAIPFAVRHGYPAAWFIAFPHEAMSTREEAVVVLAELRRRNVHSVLLVTSDYHTARAAHIFRAAERAMGGGPSLRMVAAADRYFTPNSWWRNRQGQKTAFFEWCKTFATYLGM